MIPLMPKELCNQSITLRLLDGHDKWQKPIFSDPIMINHMIFQPQTVYSGSNNNRQVVAIVDNRNPYSNEVYSYELEVL